MLRAAGQVLLLMLCHLMHSLMGPDPPCPPAELLMLQSQAMGAALDLTHLVSPPVGVFTKHWRRGALCLSHLSGHRAGRGSVPPPALAPPSHLLLERTPCTSTHPLSSLRCTSGKGMEPVREKINTPSTHVRKCQTPFSGRQRCCRPSGPAPLQPRLCCCCLQYLPLTGCAPSPPGRGFSCSPCTAGPSRAEPRVAEGCAGGRR